MEKKKFESPELWVILLDELFTDDIIGGSGPNDDTNGDDGTTPWPLNP